MRILEFQENKGIMKLKVEDEDDLWVLYTTIKPGDLLRAKTARDVSFGSSKEKINMVLTIKVTHLEFQPFTTVLRVRGIIVDGPDKFGLKGSYHTIKIYPGREFTLIKERWDKASLERIRRAIERKGSALIVAIDYDEYAVALAKGQGIAWLGEGSLHLPGKDDINREKIMEKVIKELSKIIIDEAKKRNVPVIIVGPGSLKEMLAEEVKKAGVKVLVDNASMGGKAGVLEAIRRGTVMKLVKESEALEALRLIEEVMKHVAKDDGYALYGIDEVEAAAKANAVKTLLVTDRMIHHENEEIREKIWRILEEVERKGGRVLIVPKDSEAGERLVSLGEIVALLRYPIKFHSSQSPA